MCATFFYNTTNTGFCGVINTHWPTSVKPLEHYTVSISAIDWFWQGRKSKPLYWPSSCFQHHQHWSSSSHNHLYVYRFINFSAKPLCHVTCEFNLVANSRTLPRALLVTQMPGWPGIRRWQVQCARYHWYQVAAWEIRKCTTPTGSFCLSSPMNVTYRCGLSHDIAQCMWHIVTRYPWYNY